VESLDNYDLIVVDGAALREHGELSSEFSRALQVSKTPVVWLEEDDGSHPVKRANLVVVKKPIERELFQTAVSNLLSPPQSQHGKGSAPELQTSATEETPKRTTQKRAEDPQQPSLQFIELVEVVEEGPPAKQEKKGSKKRK
jgi:hypothetical protein